MKRAEMLGEMGKDENRQDFSEKLRLLLLLLLLLPLLLPSDFSPLCCVFRKRRLGLSKPPANQVVRCSSLPSRLTSGAETGGLPFIVLGRETYVYGHYPLTRNKKWTHRNCKGR